MICVHEIIHLFTHRYVKLTINPKAYNDYKESLTVLLNIEFRDLIESDDRGYEQHQLVRRFIADHYHKGMTVASLTEQLFANQEFCKLLESV